jgi:PqqD family protein of HPr-rel-A system
MTHRIPAWIRSTHNLDGAVVLDIRTGLLFNFNSTASDLLQTLASGPTSDDALTKAISERYGIDDEVARTDVRAFLDAMREHRLIESTP